MTRAARSRLGARALGPALALAGVLAAFCATARAQVPAAQPAGEATTAPSAAELAALRGTLASRDPEARRRAFSALSSLGEDALPAIGERLHELAGQNLGGPALLNAAAELHRLLGVERRAAARGPDPELDLAQGVLPLLARDRNSAALLLAELIALLRALEAQRTPAAAELIVSRLFVLHGKLFQDEAVRTRTRFGVLFLPALVRCQLHPRPWLRSFCHDSLLALGADKPGRAVQQDDVVLLSALLLAYGDTLDFEAMPVVVSYVSDDRSEVQSAARRAVERYGKNAIWQLRERYLNVTGKQPEPGWGHQRLLAELARWFEAPKRAAIDAQLGSARAALGSGDFAAAEQALDRALQVAPFGELAKPAAALYARIAGQHEAHDRLERALSCLARALRLTPDAAAQRPLRARISYLEAELRLARGQLDLDGYARALALDPSLSEARLVLDELSGANAQRERTQRRLFALCAAALLALAGYYTWRGSRSPPAAPEPPAHEGLSPPGGA